jgi:AcrR family transcriptional regulator
LAKPLILTLEAEQTSQATRELILATAESHLRRYGYARTTVSEIARACGMSHANVYRFFKDKAAVIDAVTEQWLSGVEQALQTIAQQPTTATDRLTAYVLELHRIKRAKLLDDRELFEAFSAILLKDRIVVEHHLQRLHSILKQILADGVQLQEFQIADLDRAAGAIQDATLKFHHPLMIAEAINQATEEQASTVIQLLLVALKSGCI